MVPGAALEDEYRNRLTQLQQSIAARANSLHLTYTPDNTYQSPEVWANAYRLALYQTPAGVDGVKEHAWIEDQLTQWRAFTKTFDDRKDKLRLQAAQIQLSPTAKVTDLNSQIDDLNHRVESTQAEEEPIKAELQQARSDLADARAKEANLDAAYYQQLYKLPEQSITKRLPLRPDGRFDWLHLEKDSAFSPVGKIPQLLAFFPRGAQGRPPVLGAGSFLHLAKLECRHADRAGQLHLDQGDPAARSVGR